MFTGNLTLTTHTKSGMFALVEEGPFVHILDLCDEVMYTVNRSAVDAALELFDLGGTARLSTTDLRTGLPLEVHVTEGDVFFGPKTGKFVADKTWSVCSW